MKTATIKTPTTELMVVELPENIESDYSLIYRTAPEETYLSFRKNAGFKPPRKSEKLENGIWMVLGKPDEIKEEDATKLFYNPIDSANLTHYANLRNLFSLIELEIYWDVNPLGKEKPNFDPFLLYGQNEYWVDLKNKWQEAQEKTFDKNRSLIFVKN